MASWCGRSAASCSGGTRTVPATITLMPSAPSRVLQPGRAQRPLHLVDVDLRRGLKRLADGVEAPQHLFLALRVDLEAEDAPRGRDHGLGLQIHRDEVVAPLGLRH